jgi:hypothetical protein
MRCPALITIAPGIVLALPLGQVPVFESFAALIARNQGSYDFVGWKHGDEEADRHIQTGRCSDRRN